jgi:hypothetical protein
MSIEPPPPISASDALVRRPSARTRDVDVSPDRAAGRDRAARDLG